MDEKYAVHESNTACGRVGYAYVPMQEFGEMYPPEEALENGTSFPELNIPISEYGPTGD